MKKHKDSNNSYININIHIVKNQMEIKPQPCTKTFNILVLQNQPALDLILDLSSKPFT